NGILTFLSPLCATHPLGVAGNTQYARTKLNREGLLRPGTYGQMELVLETFKKARLLPTSAIFSYKNKSPLLANVTTHIMQVTNGVARCVPVRVQYDDGV